MKVGVFVLSAWLLACCTTTVPSSPPVELVVEGVATGVEAYSTDGLVKLWATSLRDIHPNDPNSGTVNNHQVLSFFGREGLAVGLYGRESTEPCTAVSQNSSAVDEIVAAAQDHNIVIVSESHVRTQHRAFTEDLAERLFAEGWEYFAAEAFANLPYAPENFDDPRFRRISTFPEEHFFRIDQGTYIGEAQFGRLGRTVKSLGYKLVPYEYVQLSTDPTYATQHETVNRRDAAQAANLMRALFDQDPDAKILIHVGLGHGSEAPITSIEGEPMYMMAQRLAELTGEDPLTIDQHSCEGLGSISTLARLAQREATGFDKFMSHPTEEFIRGRPTWRLDRGDVLVDIPASLLEGNTGWRIIEARGLDEPNDAVPWDSVAVGKDETDIALALPPGTYRVRAIAFD